jgi:NADP-dependent 3-hydroxy acid dehydrogenase YdfG
MIKTIFITGATAGIGKATALKFAETGNRIIINGRRKNLLDELAEEIRKEFNSEVLPLAFDIRKWHDTQNSLESLPDAWREIDILVNNAGLAAGLDPVQSANPEDWDTMIDTNIKGLLYVSRIIIPWMLERGSGHIFNIGSIAGKEVYPKGSVYCATKHAVDALTKGMRLDLLDSGIRVTQIAPGAVETEFSTVRFKGDRQRAEKVYQGYEPLQGEDVAGIIHFIAGLPDRVNINDIVIMPKAQASTTFFHKI